MKKLHILAVLTACLLIAGIAIAATGSGHNFTTSTNLHLLKPIPGITGGLGVEPSGTSWMELQNRSFDLLDAHNHSPGNGAPVPTSGLNINADLPFNSFNATLLRALRLNSQSSTLGGAGDLRAIYSVLGDLYWNNAAGTPVQITSGGGIAGTPGSIGGLASPASATYTAGTTTFTFQGATNTAATGDFGTLILREKVASALGITLQSPTGLAGAYSLTMPTALPGSDGILRLGSTGVLSAFGTISGSNLTLPGTLGVTGIASFNGVQSTPAAAVTARTASTETQSNITGAVGNNTFAIESSHTVNNFLPGLVWFTSDNNATIPKAGVYVQDTAAGSVLILGTSNNYATGITTNTTLDQTGKITLPGGAAATGGLTIGASGTAISGSFAVRTSITPGSLAANTCTTILSPVFAGPVDGSPCAVGYPSGAGNLVFSCRSVAGGCELNACNVSVSPQTPPSGFYSCRVFNP